MESLGLMESVRTLELVSPVKLVDPVKRMGMVNFKRLAGIVGGRPRSVSQLCTRTPAALVHIFVRVELGN